MYKYLEILDINLTELIKEEIKRKSEDSRVILLDTVNQIDFEKYNKYFIKNGYLYTLISVKTDLISQSYKLLLRKISIEYFSRKQTFNYTIKEDTVSLIVHTMTPLVQKVLKENLCVEESLANYWEDLVIYGENKINIDWVTMKVDSVSQNSDIFYTKETISEKFKFIEIGIQPITHIHSYVQTKN